MRDRVTRLGPVLSRADRQMLGCDATLLGVLEDAATPIATLERHRVVDWRLRALNEDRWGGCAHPGCDAAVALHIHHIVHWEDGGLTEIANLVPLCGRHHRGLHQGLFSINGDARDPASVVFLDRWGRPLGGPAPRPPDAPVDEALRAAGVADPQWVPPTGERLQADCVIWSD